ncbi:hypothetical protein [Ralstonia pseudosolanacearum]
MKALLRLVLFLDAAVALCVGLVLLASPLSSVFGALQVPQPDPAMYGQLLGVMLLGLAWLLWHATVNGQLTTAVAQVVGHVNLAVAVLVIAWLLFFHLPVDGAGRIWLPTFAAVLALFAAVQIPASRRVRHTERERATKAREEAAATRERERGGAERKEPAYMPPPGYGPGTEVDTIADSLPPQHARQSPHP